jgi:hypothetical protein
VALLDEGALSAVIEHERHHARRHDPARLAAGRVLARSLFFVPGFKALVRTHQSLAELSADESVISGHPERRVDLARAMLDFADADADADGDGDVDGDSDAGGDGDVDGDGEHPVGFDPVRVDYLLGEPVSWRFPVLALALAGAMIVALVGVAVLAGRVAAGSATLALPVVSGQPCVVVLAAIPCAVGAYAMRRRRGRAAA